MVLVVVVLLLLLLLFVKLLAASLFRINKVWNDSEGPIKTDLGRVFGFAYFFLVNLVITAIVSGIIIDTFSEMRTASKDVHLDLQKSCFVCDLESDDFERSGVSYQSHLKEDHNLWK